MANRIPWNKYETALLIEAYLKVENKEITRKDAICQMSNILRKMAKNIGIKIDRIFRNENGISLRMSEMQYLMTDCKKGLKKAVMSKLFQEMVELYRTNRTEFNKILTEAKKMVDTDHIIKNQYLTWLSTKVSPAQIAELYHLYPEIESFCLYIKILKKPLFETTDMKVLSAVKQTVDSNKVFRFKYKNQVLSMSSAIKYYYQWVRDNQLLLTKEECVVKQDMDTPNIQDNVLTFATESLALDQNTNKLSVCLASYKELLAEKYQKGFRINSDLEMIRFRRFWVDKFGFDLEEDDGIVRMNISNVTIQHQDFVYLPELMLDVETQQEILSYIQNCFLEGKKAVYFDALYQKFKIKFQGQRINNADMLKTYLTFTNKGSYVINKNYVASDKNVEVDLTGEVRNYLTNYGLPIKIDDLVESLSHIPRDKIIWAIAGNNSAEFVRNQKGEYFHADIVDLKSEELENIKKLIEKAINEKDFMGGNELIEIISIKYPAIIERYPYLNPLGMRDAIGYKLRDVFSFKGKIISTLGEDLSMSDVFADYAKLNEQFTLTQLNALKTELDTPIYFDAVYANSLRISKDDFVSKKRANFDISETDAAIDRFCIGDYITISEIRHFGSFPYVGFPWNSFLLEHYVSDYSKKYKLLHSGFNAGTPVGVIVKCTSKFEDFNDLIASALADSTIPLNRKDALQYLCDKGFLARRSYGDIEQVLIKSNMQRSQKG
ncbi:hypothetical protein [Anaerovorax sp. IOR16]|uniref:hypothetical protein n=1 Tax=Anaerovorax sp. IOR16 TaxID=2773458 RepID=UPI0019D2F747|nr:hypothetical protein [Anaerovorax sp. IOR16]